MVGEEQVIESNGKCKHLPIIQRTLQTDFYYVQCTDSV